MSERLALGLDVGPSFRLGDHVTLANGRRYRVEAMRSAVPTEEEAIEFRTYPGDRLVTLTLVPVAAARAVLDAKGTE